MLGDDAPTLLLADRFSSTVPGCTAVTDAFGTTISSDGGYPAISPEAESPATLKIWLDALEHADYVVLALGYQERRIPWDAPSLQSYVHEDFRTVLSAGYVILKRKTFFPFRTGTLDHASDGPAGSTSASRYQPTEGTIAWRPWLTLQEPWSTSQIWLPCWPSQRPS